MRVTYGREEKVKKHLDKVEVENFLPMHYKLVRTPAGNNRRKLVPAVPNLIFVHSSQRDITEMKMFRSEFEPMRYMTNRVHESGDDNIMRIPDAQMQNFMRVASVQDDSVFFLQTNDFLTKEGRHVEIIDGDFAGVRGVIKRIQRNKHVVVQLDGIAAVAIAFVPGNFLREIEE